MYTYNLKVDHLLFPLGLMSHRQHKHLRVVIGHERYVMSVSVLDHLCLYFGSSPNMSVCFKHMLLDKYSYAYMSCHSCVPQQIILRSYLSCQ